MDQLFHLLLVASFIVAPLGAIGAVLIAVGLWRSRSPGGEEP